jgi:TonB-dependent SusC/RagA subfamily outer membrane receptor
MQYLHQLHKRAILTIGLFLSIVLQVCAQDFTQSIAEKLHAYRTVYPPEKAFLHIDKPYYSVGDTLWFKAYLVEGSLHKPDSASTLLYVDLINQKTGKNSGLRRVPLNGGLGYGSFTLADSLTTGAYTVRAYTNWMRNFPEDYFFQKEIFLFDNEEILPPVAQVALNVQFFPESGRLVGGHNTRIAFKAINGWGFSEDVSGFILDQKKDTIASVKSDYLGMGKFQFSPKTGDKYQAFLKTKDGNYTKFNFPEVQDSGYTMVVDNISNPAKMRIIVYANLTDAAEKPVNIVGHSRGIIAFAAKGKVASKGLMMNIPTAELPDGITNITLFDDQNQPVAERLVFINHERTLKVKVNPSKMAFKPREKAEVEIMVTDSAGKPVEANLSVSVTDAGQIAQQPYDLNIVSFLLLSSDLKGLVEQPAYYFDPAHPERKIHLDNLMMTQGWRRFQWKDVLKDSLEIPKRFVEQGITATGETRRGNKKINEKLMLSIFLSNDSLKTFMTTETNTAGIFNLYNLVFADSLQLRIQGMNKKGNQNLTFSLFPFDAPKAIITQIPYFPITVAGEQLAAFLRRAKEYQEIERKIHDSREKLLQAVTIRAKKEVVRDSRKLYSTADATIKMTPQLANGSLSVLDILGGRVAGVRVTGQGMNASVSIRNGGEPLFVLDGMTVDKAMITNLNINDVETIDVLKGGSAAIYGSRGGNGVISVLTKRGNSNYDYSQDVIPGILVAKIAGYDIPREFYAPAYDVKRPEDARPDYRSTIFWAPQLKTGKDGKVRFQYYNTDPVTTVNIHAEVLSPSGEAGSAKTVYSVQ